MLWFQKNNFDDNPNPDAAIGFLCWSPFHYYVYKNIYRRLPDAEFVVGLRRYITTALEQENLRRLIPFLNEKGVRWRFLDSNLTVNAQRNFLRRYKAVISVWSLQSYIWRGLFDDTTIKVRALYGNAKDVYNFGVWNAYFELALAYGPYSRRYLKTYTRARVVGNPKFDDWFGNKLDEKFLRSIGEKLDPSKRTILYLPTHNSQKGLSSLPALAERPPISDEYNFIIKLHYLTWLDDKKLVEKLERAGHLLFDERDDILPLLKSADIVLSDNSGAIFDAVLADKPVILFGTKDEAFQKKLFFTTRGLTASTTYPESLEQVVKRGEYAIGPLIRSFEDLPRAAKELEERRGLFEPNSRKIKELVFGYRDDACGERAAREIRNVMENFPALSARYPLVYRALTRENLIRRGHFELRRKLSLPQKISLIRNNYFSDDL